MCWRREDVGGSAKRGCVRWIAPFQANGAPPKAELGGWVECAAAGQICEVASGSMVRLQLQSSAADQPVMKNASLGEHAEANARLATRWLYKIFDGPVLCSAAPFDAAGQAMRCEFFDASAGGSTGAQNEEGEFEVGDRVRVRDGPEDDWSHGVVSSASPLLVETDGSDGMGYAWAHVEEAPPEQEETFDSEDYLAVGSTVEVVRDADLIRRESRRLGLPERDDGARLVAAGQAVTIRATRDSKAKCEVVATGKKVWFPVTALRPTTLIISPLEDGPGDLGYLYLFDKAAASGRNKAVIGQPLVEDCASVPEGYHENVIRDKEVDVA